MMRKIIQHGPSSLTISIPSYWVKNNNLKKGDEIEVIEKNKNLIIKSSNEKESKIVEISFDKISKKSQEDVILSLHKKGYDYIKIKDLNETIIKNTYSFLNSNQLNLEIIKQEKNNIIIENISNPENEQFENLEKRSFRILIEYSYKIMQIITSKENLTENCYLHESSIKRMTNYCKRIIIKENNQNSIFNYLIIKNIENITRNVTEILKTLDKEKKEIIKNKIFLTNYENLFELMQEIYNILNKFSLGRYSKLNENLMEIEENIKENMENEKYIVNGYLRNICDNLKNLLNNILTMNI